MTTNTDKLAIEHFVKTPAHKNEYLLINKNEAAVIDVAEAYEDISGKIRHQVGGKIG